MKAVLTKEDVQKAIESLKKSGKKPTLASIHAALGNRGSITTLIKLKAEIEADSVHREDSEAGLKAFRELWDLAVEEGRRQKENELADMQQSIDAMLSESQTMEGQLAATTERMTELEAQRDSMVSELAKSNEQVIAARAAGEQHAQKLAAALEKMGDMQVAHGSEISKLRDQLADVQVKAHETELKLARAEVRAEVKQ